MAESQGKRFTQLKNSIVVHMTDYPQPIAPTYPGAIWFAHSPNSSPRRPGDSIQYFVIHHAADTRSIEVQRDRFMVANDRQVSPNWFIGADGSVSEIVPPDGFRAWTTGAFDYDAVTVETQNTTGDPTWGISEESHEAIAKLVAWSHVRWGIPLDRQHVLGHREVPGFNTLCPGPSMNLDKIVARAIVLNAATEKNMNTITLSNNRGWLNTLAAQSIARMDKVYGKPVPISSAGRSYALQVKIFLERYVPVNEVDGRRVYDYRTWNGIKYARISAEGTVAQPGTSIHEKGNAVDFGSAAYSWLGAWAGLGWDGARANRFGWRRTVSAEVWHFEYDLYHDVYFLQNELNRVGYKLVVDGLKGTSTDNALYDFQKKHDLTPDKVFGPNTYTKLRATPTATVGSTAGRVTVKPAKPVVMLKWKWTGIQKMLKATKRYTGRIDNIAGRGSVTGMNIFTKRGAVYVWDVEAVKDVQKWLRGWGYTGLIDGIPGNGTHAAWNRAEAVYEKKYAYIK